MQLTFEDIKNHMESLSNKVFEIESHTQMLSVIQNCLEDENRMSVMQGFPSFFGNILHSFRRTVIIEVCSLINERSERGAEKFLIRSLAFFDMQKDIDNSEKMKNLTESYKKILSDHKDILVKLKIQRDKYWAHYDKIYFDDLARLQREFPISTEDLVAISDAVKVLFSEINSVILGNSLDFSDIFASDPMRIIDFINEMHSLRVKLFERDISVR